MTKFKNKYRVESNRWQFWDYSAPGRYFITFCTANRECFLGYILDKKMKLSKFGEIVENEIKNIPDYKTRIILDEWKVMPNHVHLLIELTDYNSNSENDIKHNRFQNTLFSNNWLINHDYKPTKDEIKQYRKLRRRMLIPVITSKLQIITSKHINIERHTTGRNNWQSNYHDHVIRDDAEYWRIKNYIINNPQNWDSDTFNNNNPIPT